MQRQSQDTKSLTLCQLQKATLLSRSFGAKSRTHELKFQAKVQTLKQGYRVAESKHFRKIKFHLNSDLSLQLINNNNISNKVVMVIIMMNNNKKQHNTIKQRYIGNHN